MYCRWPGLIGRRAMSIDYIEREVRTHVVAVVVVGESRVRVPVASLFSRSRDG